MRPLFLTGFLALTTLASAAEVSVDTPRFRAAVVDGRLDALTDAAGRALIRPDADGAPLTLHGEKKELQGKAAAGETRLSAQTPLIQRYDSFGASAAKAEVRYTLEAESGDLTIEQHAQESPAGLWGVGWSTGRIPREYAIIVPGRSGIRLDAEGPGGRQTFDWPQSWEAQLVIIEGPGHGFYVWADDAAGRFKRLVVERGPAGWRLQFITINDAPFDALTACRSVAWHVNTYEGDWRVPARRYRQWMHDHFQPVPVAQQQPAWVQQMRACVIMPLKLSLLEELPQRFDPPQTLLYIPNWRQAGYDRDYPDYDAPRPELAPFLARAKQLGFRSMLHVNYFGVDPLNAAYQRFEPFHVRSPWGQHDHQWWLWEKATPTIKFAYINPAAKAWRELFVGAMVGVCRRLPVDALHLDQTLCIYNDHHGRIDGQSMIDGNVALHRELRAALPDVALSGEGLNEVTCRYEAFAQRHAWGLHHSEGTFTRGQLSCAHPIASYLLRPYTIIYGYLGYVSPTNDQLYAAWNEAYEHWDVIPTWRPQREGVENPRGFTRQLFDEIAFWQTAKPEADWDGPWPADVVLPYRTQNGQPAMRTMDGRLVCGGKTLSWTIRDSNVVAGNGAIDGWRAYDSQRLLGLDPQRWYACLPEEPRDAQAFHVAAAPAGAVVTAALDHADWALVSVRAGERIAFDLVAELERARCGSRPYEGPALTVDGPLQGADGAQFTAMGEMLAAHPPYKRVPAGSAAAGEKPSAAQPGDGTAFARYQLPLPGDCRLQFLTSVALGKGAAAPGRSDGVLFAVTARSGQQRLHAELFWAREEPQPLTLDLTPLAGQVIELEVSVHPGPQRHPSFDWSRWIGPQIVAQRSARGQVAVAGGPPWALAIGPDGPLKFTGSAGLQVVEATLPATLCFLRQSPPAMQLPLDLRKQKPLTTYVSDAGPEMEQPTTLALGPAQAQVGGVAQLAISAHPPDHGRCISLFPLSLPAGAAWLHTAVGIRDGSKSTGVIFRVAVNGQEVATKRMLPGRWEPLDVELSPWTGKPCVLTLTTDADGPFNYDWAYWGQPEIRAKP